MTGGTVVILGKTGDNFGAGMTGGMAFIYDEDHKFSQRANSETLLFETIASEYWTNELYQIIVSHYQNTGSMHAQGILDNWESEIQKFIHVCPKEIANILSHPLEFKNKLKQIN